MSSAESRHARLFEAFDRLCDASNSEQREALRHLRAENPALATELAALLEIDRNTTTSLTQAVRLIATQSIERERSGERVGRFIILERLGRGGMGTVYSAFDTELERSVAVKLMPRPTGDEGRWLREARAMAKVAHSNVVTVFEVGTHGNEVFIAMERVHGTTLGGWMRSIHASDAWKRGEHTAKIVDVLLSAARGLVAAHDVNLLHRDFKPDNVLLDERGIARVADFGLARPIDASTVSDGTFQTPGPDLADSQARSALAGTPAYMSPEQFEQRPLDARSDQFSFCVTAFEALYGVRPFAARQGVRVPAFDELAPLPKAPVIPEAIAAVLRRGLSLEPDQRFATMRGLVGALEAARGKKRGRVAMLGIGAVAAGAVALGLSPDSPAPDPCRHGQERLEAVWGPLQAQRLREALAPARVSYRDTVTATTLERLDAYGARWTTAYREACEATHVRHEQTEATLERRMACLQRKLEVVDINVQTLTHAGDDALTHAVEVVSDLPGLDRCADLSWLEEQTPLPRDAIARSIVEEAKRDVEAVKVALRLRLRDDVLPTLDAIEASLGTVDYPPLLAEIALTRGTALANEDRYDEALDAYTEAIMLAQEHGQHDTVARAASDLGRLYGHERHDTRTGLMWLRLAEASARHDGMSQALLSDILGARAWTLAAWDHREEAVTIAQQAVDAAANAKDGDPHPRLVALDVLVGVYQATGQIEEAETVLLQARDLALGTYHPEHPAMFQIYLHLGMNLAMQHEDQLDRAREQLDKAARIAEASPAFGTSERGRVQLTLSNIQYRQAEYGLAYETAGRALSAYEAAYGDSHPAVAKVLSNMGSIQARLGNTAKAAELHMRSLQLREEAFGADHVQLLMPLIGLGSAHVEGGAPALALEPLRRARAIAKAHDGPVAAAQLREAEYWLGVALAESDEDPDGGRTLVLDVLENTPEEDRVHKLASGWLQAHPAQ